jgi:ribosome-associated heat shock protein Hsp15
MRLDKWLWAARFFKTRALAAEACDKGRVESNGIVAKPAREVRVGDKLGIRRDYDVFAVEVLGLSEMRGPAPAAAALYRESEEDRARRETAAEERKAARAADPFGAAKPSKKNRRDYNRIRGFNA